MSSLKVYSAADAARVMKAPRPLIDGACYTGALVAVDQTPNGKKRTYRILESDLIDWHHRGRPAIPEAGAA